MSQPSSIFGRGVAAWLAACCFVSAGPAIAGDVPAGGFVQPRPEHMGGPLRPPPSQPRDEQVRQALGEFVDFDGLTQRAFGEPCPSPEPSCEDLWQGYSDAQHQEVRGLLEKLVRKTYEKNLLKTLDYDV